MPIIEQLNAAIETEDSMFRAQLMREDVARLETLQAMIKSGASEAEFLKQGAYVGWTQSDMQTHKIGDALKDLLGEFYRYETGPKDENAQSELSKAWADFNSARMEKLVRCL